jgi:CRISPR/Cas system-associated exonuclease Cas4 (RecB family)
MSVNLSQIQKQNSDTILCDAGSGEISKIDCLQCAASNHNTCGFGYALLNALFKSNEQDRKGIHVTDLTGCLRQAYYAKEYYPKEYPHDMMARFLGTAVHKYIESFNDGKFESELPVEGMGLVGTADTVYGSRVEDTKTTRWIKLDKLPYGSHVQQVNIYAALLKAQGRSIDTAAIQYIDMSGPSKCSKCRGPVAPGEDGVFICHRCGHSLPGWHPGVALVEIQLEEPGMVAEWIQTRLKILEMALENGEAPDSEVSYLCDYCPFQRQCAEE